MHHPRKKKNYFISTVALFALLLLSVVLLRNDEGQQTPFAYAGVGDNVSGYAWSQTIGWISFNCTDPGTCGGNTYGVAVNSGTGNFSGYAWSQSIGWINFDPADGVTCSSPCVKMNAPAADGTRTVTGWARACTVFAAGCSGALKGASALGGWDGWIKLTDASWTNPANRAYMGAPGTPYDTSSPRHNGVFWDDADSRLKGFAWGGEVVGWIDFFPTAALSVIIGPLDAPVINVVPVLQGQFGDVAVNASKTLDFAVTNVGPAGTFLSGNASVSVLTTPADAAHFVCTAGCAYANLAPLGPPWTVTYTFSPTAVETNQATADFTGGGNASRPINGNGVIPVTAGGSGGLDFGKVVINKTKDMVFTINNGGDGDLGSNNLVFPFPEYTCLSGCPFDLPPNTSVDVTIRFAPLAVQAYNGNASLLAYPTVLFPFTGSGVSPSFQFKDQ